MRLWTFSPVLLLAAVGCFQPPQDCGGESCADAGVDAGKPTDAGQQDSGTLDAGTDAGTNPGVDAGYNDPPRIDGQLPQGMINPMTFYDGTRFWILGGQTGDSTVTDSIVAFDPTTKSVLPFSEKLPEGRSAAAVAFTGSRAYLFGGTTASGYSNEILEFDPTTRQTVKLSATLPSKRIDAAAAWTGGSAIYVIGGYDGTYENDIIRVDISSATPSVTHLSAKMAEGRDQPGIGFTGTDIFMIGGFNGTAAATTVDRFTVAGETVTPVPLNMTANPYAANAFDGRFIYALGGDNGTTLNTITAFDTLSLTVRLSQATLQVARMHQGAAAGANRVYVFGGWARPGTFLNTIQSVPLFH